MKKLQAIKGGVGVAIAMAVLTAVLWMIPAFLSAQSTDLITSLPGYDGELASKMYSGYIPTANKTKYLHYWFIESENDPANDPVLLWMQGGPGSSGMLGLLTEMGPYYTSDDSFDVPKGETVKLFKNKFAWTNMTNMLFFESPAGVGFSYCVDKCPENNDTTAAADNYEFLVNFFKAFPEFKKNDFYITGESYGGIYVPTLAELVLEDKSINLKGVVVGDGCTGTKTLGGCGLDYYYWYFTVLKGHGQISPTTYDNLMGNCEKELKGLLPMTTDCEALLKSTETEAGTFNLYNIYDECIGSNDQAGATLNLEQYSGAGQAMGIRKRYFENLSAKVSGGLNDFPCGMERGMVAWLADTRVQSALHAKPQGNQNFVYNQTETSVFPIYEKLLAAKKKVLIFYGDVDVIVPYNGGEFWTTNFANSAKLTVERPFRPWTLFGKNRTAGHVTQYSNDFTYLTVRGAGHMVPRYKPEAAFYMLKYWLEGKDWPNGYPNPDDGLTVAGQLKAAEAIQQQTFSVKKRSFRSKISHMLKREF